MKVMFDTNVIIDIILFRKPFSYDSTKVFLLAVKEEIEGIISASSITDIYYILYKADKNHNAALGAILDITKTLLLVDTKACDIQTAVTLPMTDFEDAVLAAAAQREGANYIITRNTKDFTASPVPAVSPSEFIKLAHNLEIE